ncbi:unnamed protein product [Cuscuta epithymum]|uniref:NAC domain-containing protein n=1 Tax=Cuscuta epithymum TaxID=186058 RepID=A0AAV0CX95_9ASTE|nr:unnamed protein product [Cuscuta epithymum]
MMGGTGEGSAALEWRPRPPPPPGYRFDPDDLILFKSYLFPRVNGQNFPQGIIRETDVYRRQPSDLFLQFPPSPGEIYTYFFTPRKKRYKNGSRPSRSTKDQKGNWKITGKILEITDTDGLRVIGRKNVLVYYQNKVKTNWIMHEYVLDQKYVINGNGDAENDGVVLCRIHDRNPGNKRNLDESGDDDHHDHEHGDDHEDDDDHNNEPSSRCYRQETSGGKKARKPNVDSSNRSRYSCNSVGSNVGVKNTVQLLQLPPFPPSIDLQPPLGHMASAATASASNHLFHETLGRDATMEADKGSNSNQPPPLPELMPQPIGYRYADQVPPFGLAHMAAAAASDHFNDAFLQGWDNTTTELEKAVFYDGGVDSGFLADLHLDFSDDNNFNLYFTSSPRDDQHK